MTGPKHGWRTLSSKVRYRNPWISVREDKVVYPDGRRGIYGVLDKRPGVCVIPEASDGSLWFLRQYRYTTDGIFWELPAGMINEGESETAAAKRELSEEMGLAPGRLKRLGNFYTALGHETAEIIVYLGSGLRPVAHDRQADESILELKRIPIAQVRRMVRGNRINCGVTLSALAFYFESRAKS